MAQPVEAFATKPDDLRVNPRNDTVRGEPIPLSCPLNSSCVCFRERERDLGMVTHTYEGKAGGWEVRGSQPGVYEILSLEGGGNLLKVFII